MDCLKIKKYNDALYFGQVNPKSGLREGKGIMKYKPKIYSNPNHEVSKTY